MTDLQHARAAAAARYAELGRVLLAEVGMTESQVEPRTRLSGHAQWLLGAPFIAAPWPTTTRRRLYILAHECGHIALRHGGPGWPKRIPAHRKEYEAEHYAHAALRRHGVVVPRRMTDSARRYVGRKISQALKRGAKRENIDRDALRFARGLRPRS